MGAGRLELLARLVREVSAALVVLGLVLLSLGAIAPIEISSQAAAKSVAVVDCGSGGATQHASGITCHACRATPVDLPPVPCQAEPVQFATDALIADVGVTLAPTQSVWVIPAPRAPPRLS